MLIKLGLAHFQSITRAKLIFESGVTVLIGPNSSGKTAILRAIKALVLNHPKSSRYIQHGQDQCVVALQIDNSPGVFWTRSKTTSTYRIGGQLYTKAGRTKLHDLLPDFPLLVENERKIVHLHNEGEPLFPLDRSPSELFHLLENIFQISSSADVLKLMKDHETEHRSKQVTIEHRTALVNQKLEVIDRMRTLVPVATLRAYQTNYTTLKDRLALLVDAVSAAQKAANSLHILKDLTKREFNLLPILAFLELQGPYHRALQLHEKLAVAPPQLRNFDTKPFATLQALSTAVTTATELTTSITLTSQQQTQLKEHRVRIEAILATFTVCPLCRQPLVFGQHAHHAQTISIHGSQQPISGDTLV